MNRFYYLNPVYPESISNKREHVFLNIEIRFFKAAWSVTFDLLILELMFIFFKNTV